MFYLPELRLDALPLGDIILKLSTLRTSTLLLCVNMYVYPPMTENETLGEWIGDLAPAGNSS